MTFKVIKNKIDKINYENIKMLKYVNMKLNMNHKSIN